MDFIYIVLIIAFLYIIFSKKIENVGNIIQHRQPQFNSKDDYEILGDTKAYFHSYTMSDQAVYNEAYNIALSKYPNANGLLNDRFEFQKTVRSYIFFKVSHTEIKVFGKAYRTN